MESSAGLISAEQFEAIVHRNGRAIRASVVYDWRNIVKELNALITPLITAARVDAAGEMRELCAAWLETPGDGPELSQDEKRWLCGLALHIRALPLPPAEE